MNLRLIRKWFTPNSTIGELYVNGVFECYTLEDTKREVKVPGETCVPAGVYIVVITSSPRFKRRLPLLLGVPNYTGVRIHVGNNAADTEGCILVGDKRGMDFIGDSRIAFDRLFAKMEKASSIELTITEEAV